MLLITCPACSISTDETEFRFIGPADREDPPVGRGAHDELWQCASGCRAVFGMTRHNVGQRISAAWTLDRRESAR